MQIEVLSPQGDLILPVHDPAATLADILRRAGLPLNTRCGQRGLCNSCLVELLAGSVLTLDGHERVSAADEPLDVRGCAVRAAGPGVTIRIPARSLLVYEPQALTDFRINIPRAHAPLCRKVDLPLNGRVAVEAIGNATTSGGTGATDASEVDPHGIRVDPALQALLAGKPDELPEHALLEQRKGHWLLRPLPACLENELLGVAVDVGTTTVVLMLVSLEDGRILARASAFNRQMHLGDDVLTRINLCATDPTMLARLQQAVVEETLAPLLAEALEQTEAESAAVSCMTIAGNTTMLHLLAGADPTPMGFVPFTPAFLDHRILDAPLPLREVLGDGPNSPMPSLHLLPGAAAYVGADLIGGILASGLVYDEGPSLLVDVGTNGEIILKHDGKLVGCATAAGPAFEGSRLACGTRATAGAISHLTLTADPFRIEAEQIGGTDAPPLGLCGSAYIDLLAEGRKVGILTPTGRFDVDRVPGAEPWIVAWKENSRALRIPSGNGTRELVVTETDIAALLQAKAAIAAGILTLLARAGLAPGDVKRVYLAGGFGMHLRLESAIGSGLLVGFALDQIELVGNTSLAGAYLALLDSTALDEMNAVARRMETVELNLDPQFEERFIDQLMLP